MERPWILRSILFVFLVFLFFYGKYHPEVLETIYKPNSIRVKIEGPVLRPGFYELELGSTGRDLVEKAGGILAGSTVRLEDGALDQALEDGSVLILGKR